MRREYFSLEIRNVARTGTDEEPGMPTLDVTFDGPETELRDRLENSDGALRDSTETDVTFRLHGSLDDGDAGGVVAVTDRITGDYVLEVNVEAESVLEFIRAARRYGEHTDDAARYRVRVGTEDERLLEHEKQTLLVYSDEGELLRQHSLIPSGVEI